MGVKSFFAGLFVGLISGMLLALTSDYAGLVVGALMGGFVAGSKKSGATVGFLISPVIMSTQYLVYILMQLFSGAIDIFYFLVLYFGSLLNIYVIVFSIIGLVVGLLGGVIKEKISK